MSWGRIDDGMLEHRKWLAIEARGPRVWSECLAVWVACLGYSNRQASDGEVPKAWLARATPLGKRAIDAADALVEVGLFELREGGFALHDFLEYNESKATRNARKDATAERVRAHRNRVGNSVTAPVTNAVSNTAPGPARPGPAPSRPDLSRSELSDEMADRALGRVIRGYAARAKMAGLIWMGLGQHAALGRAVADAYADRAEDLERSLDGFFGTSDAFVIERRWAFPLWAKDPERWIGSGGAKKRVSAADYDPRKHGEPVGLGGGLYDRKWNLYVDVGAAGYDEALAAMPKRVK